MYSGGSGLSIDIHFVAIELSYEVLSPLPIVLSKHFNHPHPYIEIATAISDGVTTASRAHWRSWYVRRSTVSVFPVPVPVPIPVSACSCPIWGCCQLLGMWEVRREQCRLWQPLRSYCAPGLTRISSTDFTST